MKSVAESVSCLVGIVVLLVFIVGKLAFAAAFLYGVFGMERVPDSTVVREKWTRGEARVAGRVQSVKWFRPDTYWLELANGNAPVEKARVGSQAFAETSVGETVPVWRNPDKPKQIAVDCHGNLDRKVFPRWKFLLLMALGFFVTDLLGVVALKA